MRAEDPTTHLKYSLADIIFSGKILKLATGETQVVNVLQI